MKKAPKEKEYKGLNIKMTPEQFDAAEKLKDKQGIKWQELMRRLIDRYIKEGKPV